MLWKILIFFAVCYAGLAAWMYWGQARMVYLPNLPSRVLFSTPKFVGLNHEQVWFQAEDGTPLHGWYIPAAAAEYSVLFLHGNAGNISHRLDTIQILHELGMNVFIFDYRGFGLSEGAPSEAGTYQDAQAAFDWLSERGVPADRIVLHGRSLGGGVATWLAERENTAGLVLESTFTSMPELGSHHYGWLPVKLLTRIIYPSLERLASIDSPVLVVHSPDDQLVPISHGRALHAAARQAAGFVEIRGNHESGYLVSRDRYQQGLGAFFQHLRNTH